MSHEELESDNICECLNIGNFCRWCIENNTSIMSITKFGKILENYGTITKIMSKDGK